MEPDQRVAAPIGGLTGDSAPGRCNIGHDKLDRTDLAVPRSASCVPANGRARRCPVLPAHRSQGLFRGKSYRAFGSPIFFKSCQMLIPTSGRIEAGPMPKIPSEISR